MSSVTESMMDSISQALIKRGVSLKPSGHLVTSAVGATAVYCFFENALCVVFFFLSSILIDLDHLFDYIHDCGIRNFNFRSFCQWCYELRGDTIWLVFHSFELLFLLWVVITVLKLNIYWVSFALGVTFHLLLDCIFNPIFALSYFFIFRWRHHFRSEKTFRAEKIREYRCH